MYVVCHHERDSYTIKNKTRMTTFTKVQLKIFYFVSNLGTVTLSKIKTRMTTSTKVQLNVCYSVSKLGTVTLSKIKPRMTTFTKAQLKNFLNSKPPQTIPAIFTHLTIRNGLLTKF